MIDESPLRIRYEAVRSSLDERSRRLSRGGGSEGGGLWRNRCGLAGNEARPKYDRTRSEGLAEPRLAGAKGATQGRGQPSVGDEGSDAAGGPGTIARAGDDGRSDATVAMGLQKPRQAGEGASRDGSQSQLLEHSQAAGGIEVLPPLQPQDQGRRQTSRPRRPIRIYQHQGQGVSGRRSAGDIDRREEEGIARRVQERRQRLQPAGPADRGQHPRFRGQGTGQSRPLRG